MSIKCHDYKFVEVYLHYPYASTLQCLEHTQIHFQMYPSRQIIRLICFWSTASFFSQYRFSFKQYAKFFYYSHFKYSIHMTHIRQWMKSYKIYAQRKNSANAPSSIYYIKNLPDLQKNLYWTQNKRMLRVPLQFFSETFYSGKYLATDSRSAWWKKGAKSLCKLSVILSLF